MNTALTYQINVLRKRTRKSSDTPKHHRRLRALERLERQQFQANPPTTYRVSAYLVLVEYEDSLTLGGLPYTRTIRWYGWEIVTKDYSRVLTHARLELSLSAAQQVAQTALDALIADCE